MFKINIGTFEIRHELAFELKKDEISFEQDISIEDGLKIDVVLTKDKDESVIVEGHIDGNLVVMCSRCLKEYTSHIQDDFVAIYKEKSLITEDDLKNDVIPFTNDEIDLYDYLRQTLVIDIPMKPVCSEECKGLCAVCGKDKNIEDCDCRIELKNNPFEKLDGLKFKDK